MNEEKKTSKIETIEEVLVYHDENNPWVTLYFDRVRFPDGTTGYYNRVVESRGKDGVAILPIMDGNIGLLRQYRYPVRQTLLEIPRGFGEIGIPEKDAIRELEEETAIQVDSEMLSDLGILHPNSGLLDSQVHLFAANCSDNELSSSRGAESREVFNWFPVYQVLDAIDAGNITDSFTISAIMRAILRGLLPSVHQLSS